VILFGRLDHTIRLLQRGRERLLAQDVLALCGGIHGDLGMEAV